MESTRILGEIDSNNILSMISDVMPIMVNRELSYNVRFPSRDEWDRDQSTLLQADINWFTDGSKTPSGTGSGAYGNSRSAKIKAGLGTHATIFQAEVFAIELCALRLVEQQTRGKSIKVFSDSQAAIKALDSNRCTSKTVWSCQRALTELAKYNQLTLIWIPGHRGHTGNEIADELAKDAANSDFIGPEPALGISYNVAKRAISNWTQEQVARYWREIPGLNHSKAFIIEPSRSRAEKLLELERHQLRLMIGLYTGHCRLRHHMHKMGIADTTECRLCMEDEETANHILCECPAAARTRFETFGEAQIRPSDLNLHSPRKIINFIRKLGLADEI